MKKNIIIPVIFFVSISLLQACSPLTKDVNMEVVSIKKVIDKNAGNHEICSSFTLTREKVIQYFSIARQVDEYEFHHEAIILPCKYQGSINIDGNLLQWQIIAGGAGYLYKGKLINRRYLCKGDCCNVLPNLC